MYSDGAGDIDSNMNEIDYLGYRISSVKSQAQMLEETISRLVNPQTAT